MGPVGPEGQVGGPGVGLAGVGGVPPAPPRVAHPQPSLAHLGAHALLGDDDGLGPPAQALGDDAVAAGAVLGEELLLDGVAEPVGLLGPGQEPELVVVGALRDAHPPAQRVEREAALEGRDGGGALSARQVRRVASRVCF